MLFTYLEFQNLNSLIINYLVSCIFYPRKENEYKRKENISSDANNINSKLQYLFGTFTKYQYTLICCLKIFVLFSPLRARKVFLYDSYSTNT